MSHTRARFDLCTELRRVGSEFDSTVRHAPAARRRGAPSGGVHRGATPHNLSLALPFYLIETIGFRDDLECARAMSRSNAFAVAHFLAQDRLLDGDEEATPARSAFSDDCLLRFFLGYAALFPASSAFWTHARSYLDQYFESLSWERAVLWSDEGATCISEETLDKTLDMIGRKLAPLKCTTGAVSLLSGRLDVAARGGALVDSYHAAHQLVDDLSDLWPDARHQRWSVPLRITAERAGGTGALTEMRRDELLVACVECGAYGRAVSAAARRYASAIAIALELGLTSLAGHLREVREAALGASCWLERRVRLQGPARPEDGRERPLPAEAQAVSRPRGDSLAASCPAASGASPLKLGAGPHTFSVGRQIFIVDPVSCLFFEADDVAADALAWVRGGSPDAGLSVMELDHGAGVVEEALQELAKVTRVSAATGGRESRRGGFTPSNVVSLALNVTSRCNLACDYCYLGGEESRGRPMSRDVAGRAVQLLLDESSSEDAASLVFFGGEPLLESELVLELAGLARHAFREKGRRLSMHMTTNGTLLRPEVARRLEELGVSMLVSIDGPAGVQDAHRRFRRGRGSYDAIASNVRDLPDGVSVSARVTLTEESAGLRETVEHLAGLGFRVVHLSPVSGSRMSRGFRDRLVSGYEELAGIELERLSAGEVPRVGNFTRTMRAVADGRPRRRACGAGSRYLCVSPEGGLYLCHRFAGLRRFAVGDVFEGIDRAAVGRLIGELREAASECSNCWARFLCGGSCLYDASLAATEGHDPLRCDVQKRVFELSMWMYASLPDEMKGRLAAQTADVEPWSAPAP